MKIKYSVLFPVLFILFCLLFSIILFGFIRRQNTLNAAREKDHGLIHVMQNRIGELRQKTFQMKDELTENHLTEVLGILKSCEEILLQLKENVRGLSPENRPGFAKEVEGLTQGYETLGSALKKGDREKGLVLLEEMLKQL